jgi:hypothetical protein
MRNQGMDQKKWPLQFRFLDPTLSVSPLPLPGSRYQLEVATSCQISLSATPTGAFLLAGGSSFLVLRTNLLSPSVALLPVFKVTQITATEVKFDRCPGHRQHFLFKKSFPQDIRPQSREIRLALFFR